MLTSVIKSQLLTFQACVANCPWRGLENILFPANLVAHRPLRRWVPALGSRSCCRGLIWDHRSDKITVSLSLSRLKKCSESFSEEGSAVGEVHPHHFLFVKVSFKKTLS